MPLRQNRQALLNRVTDVLRERGYRMGATFVANNDPDRFVTAWVGPGPEIFVRGFGSDGFEIFAPVCDQNDVTATIEALKVRIDAAKGGAA